MKKKRWREREKKLRERDQNEASERDENEVMDNFREGQRKKETSRRSFKKAQREQTEERGKGVAKIRVATHV